MRVLADWTVGRAHSVSGSCSAGGWMNGGSICSPLPLCPRFSTPTSTFLIQFLFESSIIWDLKVRIWLNIATEVFYKTSGDGMNGGSVCSPRPLCPRFSKPTTIFFIQFQICKTEHDNAQQRKYLTEYLATWKDALFAIQCITSLF